MIGLDLDGTILTDKKELLPYTKHILKEAMQQGIYVLAATGRPFVGIPSELRDFPGIQYALTLNGARVIERNTGKSIIKHLLSVEKAKKTLETLEKYDTLQEVYFEGQGYVESKKLEDLGRYHRNPNMWQYVRQSREAVLDLAELVENKSGDVDKLNILFPDENERKAAWKELEQQEGIVLSSSVGYNIEINAAGVNKGKSLVELGKMLGIQREEIMAIGDGDNDLEMMKAVGCGIAMGNAEPAVKAAAYEVTLSNEEEGAAKAIVKYALRGGELC